ncbi:methyltransferase, TIGR04325 family [Pseudooceanicola aestuarii]|uniref:methyltransferase, TIGR04325 family n=1 Tax=Pseudooceanicola aestuarii TaxID=2697319 RepID=UPI0019533DD9|nr:methyltransferase, TIGR04325 family [Pseudooceanicola aestuarii]
MSFPRSPLRLARMLAGVGLVHLRAAAGRHSRFRGAWPDRAAALAALPADHRAGYDSAGIADVSFAEMCQRAPWDYPVLFWLDRLLPRDGRLIDAGGHLGTKYIAFADLLDLGGVRWTVQDLPAIVAHARRMQAAGALPAALEFCTDPAQAGRADVLLASGLLQYLDRPLPELLGQLTAPPRHLILNKVALRDGPTLVTLERIGTQRVPYRIRGARDWQAELAATGYRLADQWDIPELGHVIPTHPWTGRSYSRGYLLHRD